MTAGILYSHSLETLIFDFVAEKLIESISPRLSEHLKTEGAGPALYATKWYLTVFLGIF